MLRWKRKVLAIKPEASYGTDPIPTAAANAVLARNVRLRPLEHEGEERIADTGYYGHLGEIVAGTFVGLDFEVELAGAGAAGTAPAYGPLLKACGCSETINVGVSVVYAPVALASAVSVATYFWIDGRRHKITGQLGNAQIMLPKGRLPYIAFSLLGLFNAPDDNAVPSPTLSGWIKPVPVNKVNTTPMTLGTFAGVFADFRLDFGNQMKYRNLPNSEAIRLLERKSSGSCRLESELVATKDWWTLIKNMTTAAFTCTHGQTAGNKVVVAAAQTQIVRPQLPVEDELLHEEFGLIFQPSSAGNDEWSITVQ